MSVGGVGGNLVTSLYWQQGALNTSKKSSSRPCKLIRRVWLLESFCSTVWPDYLLPFHPTLMRVFLFKKQNNLISEKIRFRGGGGGRRGGALKLQHMWSSKTIPEILVPGIGSTWTEAAATASICSSVNWWMRLPWRPVGGEDSGQMHSANREEEQKGLGLCRNKAWPWKQGEKHLQEPRPISPGFKKEKKNQNTQVWGTTEETLPYNPPHEGQGWRDYSCLQEVIATLKRHQQPKQVWKHVNQLTIRSS